MKNSMKAGLVLAGVVAGLLAHAWAAEPTAASKPKYEYWITHGQASIVKPQMEGKLIEGFEVDRLETSGVSGYSQTYVFVVLKREQTH